MLQTVKDYLKITWSDEDAHIQGIIDRGKAYLDDLCGTVFEFSTPTEEAQAAYVQALAGVLEAVRRAEDPMTIQAAIAEILAAEVERDQYAGETKPQLALLLDYCRYAYNNATEYFLENFREDLLRLQLSVAASEEAEGDEE